MTWTWLGIVAVLVLGLSCYGGYRKGFVREIIGITFLFLSIFLTWAINPYVNQFIKTQTPIYEKVREACENGIQDYVDGQEEETGEPEETVITRLPLPELIKDGMQENNKAEVYQFLNAESFEAYLAGYLATAITNGISFLLSYILASVVLRIVIYALDLVANLPGIRSVNRLAGLLLGTVRGDIFIWIGLLVITIFCNTEWGAECLRIVERDPLLNFFYKQDVFVKIFMSIFYSA